MQQGNLPYEDDGGLTDRHLSLEDTLRVEAAKRPGRPKKRDAERVRNRPVNHELGTPYQVLSALMVKPEYHPTQFAEVNRLLQVLQQGIADTLGDHVVGLYLDGSLARGGFDTASDIDFVAVTNVEVDEPMFWALQRLHEEIGRLDSPLAQEIEGYYVSQVALRRYDPSHKRFPNLERGLGERLKWVEQGHYWIIHRYILREHAVVLLGPSPAGLIDPISPDELRCAMGQVLDEWGGHILREPHKIAQAGYQPYAVLSLCRMLYTLEKGHIVPKAEAAAWARRILGERWQPLIEQALTDRLKPGKKPSGEQAAETMAFLEYATAYERAFGQRGVGILKNSRADLLSPNC